MSAQVNKAIQHPLHPLGRNANADLGSLPAYHDRRVAENSHYRDGRLSLSCSPSLLVASLHSTCLPFLIGTWHGISIH